MPKKENQPITYQEIEKLLGQQTTVILGTLSEKTSALDKKLIVIDKRLDLIDKRLNIVEKRLDLIDKRFDKLEAKFDKKFNHLITTLDKFLRRMTDIEDEFKIMKADINRLKKIVSDKLGIDIL